MYLLDTNALIILCYGEVTTASLSKESMDILENSDELYLSEISLWEIAIKIKINKLDIKDSIEDIAEKCRESGIQMIPVSVEQFGATMRLPFVQSHPDPFDRLIISVAKMNDLTLVTTDKKIESNKDPYGISVIQ